MWQLKIIIEISSRKELLGPIWSLPLGPGCIIPSSTHSCFVLAGGECLEAVLSAEISRTPQM